MIGWYVHHQGRGHLTRARAVAAHLAHLGQAVTVLSSIAPEAGLPWVELARDDDGSGLDATADGLLHWVPTDSLGLPARMAAVAAWIAAVRPSAVVVDVSVEVAVLARLCGTPVIVFAGPGDRDDRAHQLGYDAADHIVAPWARDVYDPPFLHRHRHKVSYVGAISRFDEVDDARRDGAGTDVVVLSGAGGTTLRSADLAAAARAVPERTWVGAGIPGRPWVEDVWELLMPAGVVVTHAGQNALAEVAAARRPAVVVAQARPHDEQVRVAAALTEAGLAVSVPRWPEPAQWPGLLDAALSLGGGGWKRWSTGGGARTAAESIERIARR